MLEVFRTLGLDPVRPARGRRPEPRPRAARTRRRLRPRLVRPALRAPRDLRGVQQGSLPRPGERVPVVPRDLSRNAPRTLAENAEVAKRVLERIRADGPLSALDFERERGATTDWFGMPTNAVRAVLEAYAVTGVLGLARRDGNRRYYDLLERLLPADVLARELPLGEQLRHKLLSRYRAHGLLGVGGVGDVFGGLGPAKPDPRWPDHPGRNASARGARRTRRARPRRGRGRARQALRHQGGRRAAGSAAGPAALRRVPSAVRSARLGPRPPREPVRVRLRVGALLATGEAPLGLVRAADRLPGPLRRPDRAADRPGRGRVQVLDVWWEDGFAPRRADGFVDAMREALRAYLASRARPASWAPHLGARSASF